MRTLQHSTGIYESVYALAFNPVADSAALHRLDDALANHVFRVGADSEWPPVTPGDSAEPTLYVYVNGIWTSRFPKAEKTLNYLRLLVSNVDLLATPRHKVRLFSQSNGLGATRPNDAG